MAEFEPIKPLHPILQEIEKQTDPHRFMDPYDAVKVKCANELHNKVYKVNIHNSTSVMDLLIQTVDDLDCTYTPQIVYQYLHEQFDPTKHQPDFDRYNNLHQKISLVKDDIRRMNQVIMDENGKIEAEREAKRKKEEEEWKKNSEILFISLTIITVGIVGIILIAAIAQ